MITVENLSFTHRGAVRTTLSDLAFTVEKGEIYGLLGPSGAGKSTTQQILMGLLPGYSGRAEVLGSPVGSLGRNFYQRIGVSFELPALYLRLTALENLSLFAALYANAPVPPIEALRAVDLEDAADQRVETFSKGMKMRLNLARALLNDPELLFLDEPTTGQDPARARITRDLLIALKARGKTVFLTTHNMTEAAGICDRVGFLVGGNIVLDGRPVDLMRQYGARQVAITFQAGAAPETRVFAIEGIGENQEFLAAIRRPGLLSIHTLEATLDDVFIAVAGKAA